MSDSPPSTSTHGANTGPTSWLEIVLLGIVSILAFAPLMGWLYDAASKESQILHAFIVLGFAGVMLTLHQGEKVRLRPIISRPALYATAFSTLILLTDFTFKISLLYPVSLMAMAFAWLHIFLGRSFPRIAYGWTLAFCVFLLLIILFPVPDWPLRMLAGHNADWIFKNLGVETKLGLFEDTASNTIKLIFMVDGRPFEVAPECNGFGVMGSAVLLASLLAVARGGYLITVCVAIAGALLLGYLANTLRIVIILILAPSVGDHYFVMHEIVGTVIFLGTLFLIWRLWAPQRTKPLQSE